MIAMSIVLVLMVGMAVGFLLGRTTAPVNKPEVEKQQQVATCGCKHIRSMHLDQGKGHCAVATNSVNAAGHVLSTFKCPCQFYDGPEPLPEFYAPEIEG